MLLVLISSLLMEAFAFILFYCRDFLACLLADARKDDFNKITINYSD